MKNIQKYLWDNTGEKCQKIKYICMFPYNKSASSANIRSQESGVFYLQQQTT